MSSGQLRSKKSYGDGVVIVRPAGSVKDCDAQGAQTGARSDLFSLGVVRHELLSGHASFVGETPMGMIAAVLTVEPLPPKKLSAGSPVRVAMDRR